MPMSPELALLHDVWDTVKPHVQKKDRLDVADSMLRMFEEHLSLDDIEVYKNDFDSVMKAAIASYFDYLDDDDDESDDDYDYED
jgi:hypothetical protein